MYRRNCGDKWGASCYASAQAPVREANDPRDVLNVWNTLDGRWQCNFLHNIQRDWVPYVFNLLPENLRRYVLNIHKVELRREQMREKKGPQNVTKLTGAAQRLLGDIEIRTIGQYTVRLSKPLPELSTPEDRSVILCYATDELGNWTDIFGNTELFGNRYNNEKASIQMFNNASSLEAMYPFGEIRFEPPYKGATFYRASINPNITISPDRMTISWNPTVEYHGGYTSDGHGTLIKEDKNFKYYKGGDVLNKATGEIENQPK